MKKCPLLLFLSTLLISILIGGVRARGGDFYIDPLEEVVENVELSVSDEVLGNLSVRTGAVLFYITNPSGEIVLSFQEAEFTNFNFTARENGNYTMHLSNVHYATNVNATLSYAIHFKVNLQANINFGASVGTAHVIGLPPPTPTPWE